MAIDGVSDELANPGSHYSDLAELAGGKVQCSGVKFIPEEWEAVR
jgi:hypothetical protein